MSKEMLNALDTLEAEKGVSKEIVIEALEAALISAYKRHYGQSQNVEVEFDQKREIFTSMRSKKFLKKSWTLN